MELLRLPAFWAVHMWHVTQGPVSLIEPDTTRAHFRLSEDELGTLWRRELSNELEWPVFRVLLRGGCSIEFEYANFPEDHDCGCYIVHPDWSSPLCIGRVSGHWRLPALRWRELVRINEASVRDRDCIPGTALLLFLPTVWLSDDDDRSEVRDQLTTAWANLKVVRQSTINALVEDLIVSATSDVPWAKDSKYGWINDDSHSCRNPSGPCRLTDDEFQRIAVFFETIEAI